MPEDRSVVYEGLRAVLHRALRIFYRRIEIAGAELVPEGKPLIFVGNHVNGIVDPLLIALVTQRQIRFMAKAPLFQTLTFGPLLRSVNALPVHRRDPRDYPDGKIPEDLPHDEMFKAAYDTLARGGNLCLFPEGISHTYPQLQELKTGAARILLGAEAQHGYSLDVQMVPVGLTFENQGLFRSHCFIRVGPPLSGRPYFDLHRQDPVEAARRLTADLKESLRGVTLNFETEEEKRFFLAAAEMVHGRKRFDERLLQVVREWTPVYRFYREQRPEVLEGFKSRLADYIDYRDAINLQERSVNLRASAWAPLLFVARAVPVVLAALIFVPAGFVMNAVPFFLCRIVGRSRKFLDERATAQMVAGFLFYPPTWLAWAIGIGLQADHLLAGVGALFAAPLLGLLSVWIVAFLGQQVDVAKAFFFFRMNSRLQEFLLRKRAELMRQLEDARREAELAQPAPAPPGVSRGVPGRTAESAPN